MLIKVTAKVMRRRWWCLSSASLSTSRTLFQHQRTTSNGNGDPATPSPSPSPSPSPTPSPTVIHSSVSKRTPADNESVLLQDPAAMATLAQSGEELHKLTVALADSKPAHSHVKFINAALARVRELDTDMDIIFYNTLLNIFPKNNSFKTASWLDAVWPRPTLQSTAALDVLNHMEEVGLLPDQATYDILLKTFGKASQPVKKARVMAYWMGQMVHANPFSITEWDFDPKNEREFAMYCIQRMAGSPSSSCHEVVDTGGNPAEPLGLWISHTDAQLKAISKFARQGIAMTITGPHMIWAGGVRKPYLSLKSRVHTRQGISEYVLGMCNVFDPTLSGITSDLSFFLNDNIWDRSASLWRDNLVNLTNNNNNNNSNKQQTTNSNNNNQSKIMYDSRIISDNDINLSSGNTRDSSSSDDSGGDGARTVFRIQLSVDSLFSHHSPNID